METTLVKVRITENTVELKYRDGSSVFSYGFSLSRAGAVRREISITCKSETLIKKAVACVRETLGLDELDDSSD